jgi:hypothetical protein
LLIRLSFFSSSFLDKLGISSGLAGLGGTVTARALTKFN